MKRKTKNKDFFIIIPILICCIVLEIVGVGWILNNHYLVGFIFMLVGLGVIFTTDKIMSSKIKGYLKC